MACSYYDERSTYHETIVHRVYAQLKRHGCTADFERSLVPGRVMDTYIPELLARGVIVYYP